MTGQMGLFDGVKLAEPEPTTTVKLGRKATQIPLRKKRREAIKRLMEILEELEGKDIYIGSYDAGGRHFWLDNLKLTRLQLEWHPSRLNNIDKHRHLHVVTGQYEGTFNRDESDLQAWRDIQDRLFLNVGRVEAGTILAEIPRQYAHIEFVPTFEFAFSETNEFAAGNRVRGTVGGIGVTVECVLDQFERLFFFKDSSALGRLWHAFSSDPFFS